MIPNWLADRLARPDVLVVPGAFDAFSSRLVSLSGHEAVYVGGYAALAAAHGFPDLGIAGRSDMVDIHRRVSAASNVPVIVDADTGYGGPVSVRHTVTELVGIGVAAVQLEDQVNPKRCGHVDHKQVVSIDEACMRIRVAVDATTGTGTAIIARTDALQTDGVEHAIDRANRFLECGATAVFVDTPRTFAEATAIPRGIDGPVIFNAAATGHGPTLGISQLQDLGYAMVIFPIEAFLAAMNAVQTTLAGLHQGRVEHPAALTFNAANHILGLPQLVSWERGLMPADLPALG